MIRFAGRQVEMNLLGLDASMLATRGAQFVMVRGRRQVGKSRLVEEFVRRAGNASIFFTATKGRQPHVEIAEFVELAQQSGIDGDGTLDGVSFATWDAALAAVARLVTQPTVVVVDEFPYLVEGAPDVEGSFQKAWDRHLRKAPVMLILIGSDLAMMAALTQYGRPLFGRPTRELHLGPLNPAETAELIGLPPRDAFDAFLVTGGFPNLVNQWARNGSMKAYLKSQLASSSSVLVVTGERMLAAEFSPDSPSRQVLSSVGMGSVTFAALGNQTGIGASTLDRTLKQLKIKGVVVVDAPVCAGPSHETRYRIADVHLRFWLRFIERSIPQLERARGADVVETIMSHWSDYRRRAIEPVVVEAVGRLAADGQALNADVQALNAEMVGAYWTRSGSTEVDLVGVVGPAKRPRVSFVGSIKWRDRRAFDGADAANLAAHMTRVPGVDAQTKMVAVSSSGFSVRDVPVCLGPAELLAAWR